MFPSLAGLLAVPIEHILLPAHGPAVGLGFQGLNVVLLGRLKFGDKVRIAFALSLHSIAVYANGLGGLNDEAGLSVCLEE